MMVTAHGHVHIHQKEFVYDDCRSAATKYGVIEVLLNMLKSDCV